MLEHRSRSTSKQQPQARALQICRSESKPDAPPNAGPGIGATAAALSNMHAKLERLKQTGLRP